MSEASDNRQPLNCPSDKTQRENYFGKVFDKFAKPLSVPLRELRPFSDRSAAMRNLSVRQFMFSAYYSMERGGTTVGQEGRKLMGKRDFFRM